VLRKESHTLTFIVKTSVVTTPNTYYTVIFHGDRKKSSTVRLSAMQRMLLAAFVQMDSDWKAVRDFSIVSVLAGRCKRSNTRL
jgi:hypothetical protein